MREKGTSWKGREYERWMSLELLRRGYNCAEPLVDLGADLWVETLAGIIKAQVKVASQPSRGRPEGQWRLLVGNGTSGARRKDNTRPRVFSDYRSRGVAVVFAVRPDFGGCWIVSMPEVRVEKTYGLSAREWERWGVLGDPPESRAGLARPHEAQLLLVEGSR